MPDAIFIIVLHASVFGMSGVTLSEDAKHQLAFVNLEDCRKAIPAMKKQIKLPGPASLDRLECRKLELRR